MGLGVEMGVGFAEDERLRYACSASDNLALSTVVFESWTGTGVNATFLDNKERASSTYSSRADQNHVTAQCDEIRPECQNCLDRDLSCDYSPRVRPQKQRRRQHEQLPPASTPGLSPAQTQGQSQTPGASSTSFTPFTLATTSPDDDRFSASLPDGLNLEDWPFPLTSTDYQAIRHYTEDFIPRMVLKAGKWSSYAFLLKVCTKHPLLGHLVLAFSIRDMADADRDDLNITAIEHYHEAHAMFIEYLGFSERQGWMTFPALWLFIHYEQQYGHDPQVLRRHLRGVRDVIASQGPAILPGSIGGFTTLKPGEEMIPRGMSDRLALWTIYHDAHASTFGYDGGLIQVLNENYPGAITRIKNGSMNSLREAWGRDYPAEEALWDLQLQPVESLIHESTMLRYKISKIEHQAGSLSVADQLRIGEDLSRLANEHSAILSQALSRQLERHTINSNRCVAAAAYFAVVARYERLVYKILPTSAVSKILKACASLHEHEGEDYLWRVAWPLFVGGLETDDPIHQSWVLDRFNNLQKRGENMRRAKVLLEAVLLEQRVTNLRVDYLAFMKTGLIESFVI